MPQRTSIAPRNADRKLPTDLAGFRDLHHGETLVVCGCGNSLNCLVEPGRFITIGVNDVGRLFDPTYLVVLNKPTQFKGDRFQFIQNSRSRALFTQLSLPGIAQSQVIRFKLGKRGGTDFSSPTRVPHTNNSPYVALCLAAYMGATRIGLIGVDFTDHHFFAQSGRHPLARSFTRIDREYRDLARALELAGIEVLNLSTESRLSAFKKVTLVEFAAMTPRPLRVIDKEPVSPSMLPEGWTSHGRAYSSDADGQGTLNQSPKPEPGGERGLASLETFTEVELSFDLRLHPGSHFLAKVHQADQLDQTSNSYHLACHGSGSSSCDAYVARHNQVLGRTRIPFRQWVAIKLRRVEDSIQLLVDGVPVIDVMDGLLKKGYGYLGTKGGKVELRKISLSIPNAEPVEASARGESHKKPPLRLQPATTVIANPEGLKIAALVPTRGDRPKFLKHCLDQLRSQTRSPDEIILVDDAPRSEHIDITWRYRLGVERARAKSADAIVICEDDDWYHREYIEWLIAGWLEHDRPPLFGVSETWYYHLGVGKRKHLKHPGRASGFCTLISGSCPEIRWPSDRQRFVDLHLWRNLPGKAIPFGDKIRAIGVKHGVGVTGGAAHKGHFRWEPANARGWFEKHLDTDSRRFYSEALSSIPTLERAPIPRSEAPTPSSRRNLRRHRSLRRA